MKARKLVRLAAAAVVGLGLVLAVGLLLNGAGTAVAAAPAEGIPRLLANGAITRYVAVTGTDTGSGATACINPASPCRTIQYAIDEAASGDEILIATGVYTRNGEPRVAHVVDKGLTLRGGYSVDFGSRAPDTYATTLDGEGVGPVVWVWAQANTAGITPTLEALRVTNGVVEPGAGGGVYVQGDAAHPIYPIITGCVVYSNAASLAGGGIYVVYASGGQLTANEVYSNAAHGASSPWNGGGGIGIVESDGITLTRNRIYSNTAPWGGGVVVHVSDDVALVENEIHGNTSSDSSYGGGGVRVESSYRVTLSGNEIYTNTAHFGGGVFLLTSPAATLTANAIYDNHSEQGGGVKAQDSQGSAISDNDIYSNTSSLASGGVCLGSGDGTTMSGNRIRGNTSQRDGAGLSVGQTDGVTITNNWVAENVIVQGGYVGAGIHIEGSNAALLHNTVARNSGGDGSGVYVEAFMTTYSTAALTNTIIVSQTVGLFVAAGNEAVLDTTLWGMGDWANGTDYGGGGTISFVDVDHMTGDPGFIDADGGDYHIGSQSAARDTGVDAGVTDDIDGEARPFGAPDIGADEVQCHVRIGSTYYATVQDAVDAASQDDLIQVAGTCYASQSGPMVNIGETLTLRGGYSGDFSAWDPDAYPTTLDALGYGGVVRISGDYSPTLEALRVTNGNSSNGGGIESSDAHPVISGCQILSNRCSGSGGGVYLANSDNASLVNSAVLSNAAQSGLKLGGGLFAQGTSGLVLVNNILADNSVGSGGGGSAVYLNGSDARLWHTTIARNRGGAGSGVLLVNNSTGEFTNTILVSHTVGLQTASNSAATLTATLWGNGPWGNGTDTTGVSITTGTANWWALPAFVDYENLDYHLGAGSAAFDKGVSTSICTDIDGDPRSVGTAPDLGADEALPVLSVSKAGPALADPGELITYTLTLTNSGVVTASVIVTDSVPVGAYFVSAGNGSEAGGVVTWGSFDVLAGEVVFQTFSVTATQSISNTDYVATALGLPPVAGAVAVHTEIEYRVYLPLVLRSY